LAIFTAQAEEQVQSRNNARELVLDTFENPHQRIPRYKGRRIYQSRYFEAFENKEMLIRAITEIRGDDLIIISIYKTSNLATYWSEA
jgi:hypothetical protein